MKLLPLCSCCRNRLLLTHLHGPLSGTHAHSIHHTIRHFIHHLGHACHSRCCWWSIAMVEHCTRRRKERGRCDGAGLGAVKAGHGLVNLQEIEQRKCCQSLVSETMLGLPTIAIDSKVFTKTGKRITHPLSIFEPITDSPPTLPPQTS